LKKSKKYVIIQIQKFLYLEIGMNYRIKRLSALALIMILLATLAFNVYAAPQPVAYNSGTRHEVCSSLSDAAQDYYSADFAYDRLSRQSSDQLLISLRALMTSTHTYTAVYSDCRDLAPNTDCENGEGINKQLTTIYTSYQSSYSEYNKGSGWNREHVWPKSLGGFNTDGAGADLHHIRPSENRTNSARGNLKYGYVTGGASINGNLSGLKGGDKGSFYEPLDNAKGDVARICLYVYVRYGGELTKCSNITNVFQSIDVLLEWCALDPVDEWEMGRNDVVEGVQGNRNVFIDYPEYAWLLFGKQLPADMTTPSGKASQTPPVSDNEQTADGACDHTFSEWESIGDGAKFRACIYCGMHEFSSPKGADGAIYTSIFIAVGAFFAVGAVIGIVLVYRRKNKKPA